MRMLKLVFCLVGLFFLFSPEVFAHSKTQVIEITPEGFIPSEVTVDKNSSVIFINKSEEYRWPASNTHPTHELYPEFDARKGLKPGESWAFKPKREGAWKYHDHLFPHQRGILIVTKENAGEADKETYQANVGDDKKNRLLENFKNFIDKTLARIKSAFNTNSSKNKSKAVFNLAEFKSADYSKQEALAENMKVQLGAEKTWGNIKTAFKGESGTSGGIHDLAHLAGNFLYQEKGIDGLKFCSNEFAFGCYHGLLDRAFSKSLKDLSKAEKSCLRLGRKDSGPVASCVHGIGHGIASYYLTKDIKMSLSTCRKLSSGQEFCFDGVFMEFVRSAPDSFYKAEDLLYPCNSLEDDFGYAYSFSCGRNQPSLLMGRFNMTFENAADLCINASSERFKEGCIEALGFHLAGTLDPKRVIEGCTLLGEFGPLCIQKAAGELVFQNVPNWREKSFSLCNSLSSEEECLGYVNSLASEYGR